MLTAVPFSLSLYDRHMTVEPLLLLILSQLLINQVLFLTLKVDHVPTCELVHNTCNEFKAQKASLTALEAAVCHALAAAFKIRLSR